MNFGTSGPLSYPFGMTYDITTVEYQEGQFYVKDHWSGYVYTCIYRTMDTEQAVSDCLSIIM